MRISSSRTSPHTFSFAHSLFQSSLSLTFCLCECLRVCVAHPAAEETLQPDADLHQVLCLMARHLPGSDTCRQLGQASQELRRRYAHLLASSSSRPASVSEEQTAETHGARPTASEVDSDLEGEGGDAETEDEAEELGNDGEDIPAETNGAGDSLDSREQEEEEEEDDLLQGLDPERTLEELLDLARVVSLYQAFAGPVRLGWDLGYEAGTSREPVGMNRFELGVSWSEPGTPSSGLRTGLS